MENRKKTHRKPYLIPSLLLIFLSTPLSGRKLKVFLEAVGARLRLFFGLDAVGIRLKDFLGLEAVGMRPMAFLELVTDEISVLDTPAV